MTGNPLHIKRRSQGKSESLMCKTYSSPDSTMQLAQLLCGSSTTPRYKAKLSRQLWAIPQELVIIKLHLDVLGVLSTGFSQ